MNLGVRQSIFIMPENWDVHKAAIEELYMKRGYTLEKLRRTMRSKYGINASYVLKWKC